MPKTEKLCLLTALCSIDIFDEHPTFLSQHVNPEVLTHNKAGSHLEQTFACAGIKLEATFEQSAKTGKGQGRAIRNGSAS